MTESILNNFHKDDLLKIAKQEGIKFEAKVSKKRVLDAIVSEIEDAGMKSLTGQMKLVELAALTNPFKIDHGTNNPTKVVLRKRFIEKMEEFGLDKFLSKSSMTPELLSILITAADEEPLSKDKDKLVSQASEIINLVGFQSFFSRFDTPFLQHLLSEMDLKCDTSSKDKMIYALATQTNAKKQKTKHEEITFSKEKEEIKKGITYQDIYQHYRRDEILDWCRENELKVSGSKKELINRVLDFLDGDKENTMANANKKTEEEEEETVSQKKSPKKSPKKKTPTKKEKKEEKEKEEEIEDESEEMEIQKKGNKKSNKKSSSKDEE